MSSKELNWKFADEIVSEGEVLTRARAQSLELGIEAISPAVGAQSAVIVAASGARAIAEIGTGVGVSGLWLLAGAHNATLTSIDSEAEYQQLARGFFSEAGIASNRVRLITGRAAHVLPRMNEGSYDVVFVDADPASVLENVEHAIRLTRAGGTVLLPHALWKDHVSDPVQREDIASGFRSLITEVTASPAVVTALSPAGDGLLQITKLGE